MRAPTKQLRHGVAAAAVATLALTGCSGTGTDSSGGSTTGPASLRASDLGSSDAAKPGVRADAAAAESAPSTRGGQATTADSTLLSRDVIQRAGLTVHTRDVADALAQTRQIVGSVRGVIATEQTETGRRGRPRRSTLTLRVPVDAFNDVLARLKTLGTLGSQQVSVEDVSAEVIDVEARIISAERTLDRIRDLLQRADEFSEVLSLEGELARREADLASLQAQQAYLEDQTSLSTIDLSLVPPVKQLPPPEPDEDVTGFVGGLGVGWDALVGVVTVALTALGVVAPLLLLLVPVALLAWWGVRRIVRRLPRQPAAG